MKTIIQFLLMLTLISTTYSLEPYKIVKVHDSTVFKARLSEDLKTLVVLGDNKVVYFYNTEDWTKTKSIRVYPRDKNYDISISGDTVYWLQYGYTIGSMNTADTSKISWKTPKTLGETPPRISEFFIFDNGDLMVPYRVDQYANPEYHYIYAVINDVPNVPMGIIYGYNYNRNLIVGHGGYSKKLYQQGSTGYYISEDSLAILSANSKVIWTTGCNSTIEINLAIKNDNTLIGFTDEMIYNIDASGKVTTKPKSQLSSYFLDVSNLNYILPMKDDRFLLFCYDKEIKLVQAETGNIIDNYVNDKSIVNVSNLPFDYQFLLVDNDGFAKIFNGDSLLNSFSAEFNADQTVIPVDSKVTFHPYNDLNAISYKWDFGDGGSSNEKDPVHLYSKAGRFDVSLEISDGTRSIKNIKKEYIEVKGIKFFSQYSIDTAWTKGQLLSFSQIDYNQHGDRITAFENSGKIISLNSNNGEILQTKDYKENNNKIKISPQGDTIGSLKNNYLCLETFKEDTCSTNIEMNVYMPGYNLRYLQFQFIPNSPLVIVHGAYNGYNNSYITFDAFFDYKTGQYRKDISPKLNKSWHIELMNVHTGNFLISTEDAIFNFNPRTNTSDTLLVYKDYSGKIGNDVFNQFYLYNDQNDLIILTQNNQNYNYNINRFTHVDRNLEKVGEIASDSLDNFKFYTFIENSNNMIILRPGGLLDILDYVKNEIVDHAEIPAEFTGLSINPKGGEFATLSDDGKVIVWKTKNIPLAKYEEPKVDNRLTVYPNPAGDYINIESMFEDNSIKTATIYSPLGNKLIETENQTTIDISNLYYGVYFVKVGNRYVKFVKI